MKVSKKVVILGHFGVGKSSLMRRFVEDTFSEDYVVTIGVHIMKKEVYVKDKTVTLVLWDIEGIDDFTKYRSSYLLGANAFIYVFDAARAVTYKDVNYNLDYLSENHVNVNTYVVANKIDLIDKEVLKSNLEDYGITCNYYASAKTGDNVEEMFEEVAKELA